MRDREYDITLDALADSLEGKLSEAQAAEVRDALAASAEIRADYLWLQGVAHDLEAIGAQVIKGAPEIDVVDAVLRAVDRAAASEKTVHLEERKPARPSFALWGAVALAAAAVVVIMGLVFEFGIFGPSEPSAPVASQGPARPPVPDERVAVIPPDETPGSGRLDDAMEQLERELAETLDTPSKHADRGGFLATDAPVLGNVTQDDVVALRQAAVSDPDAWVRLKRMATLDAATAAEVVSNPEVSPDAIVGAAASLPDEEARQWLVTAVGRMDQQKPYAGLALATTYMAQPAPTAEQPAFALFDGMTESDLRAFLSEMAALQEADPENALLDALRAGALLRLGDTDGALAALASLQGKDLATAYGLDAARSRQLALAAAGMSEESARMLSAVLAGSDQYNMLCDLARDLLQSGQAHEAQGDPDTARQIYEATQRLGEQVTGNAVLSEESLAGIDIQRMAMEGLEALYAGSDLAGEMERLTTSALALVSQINSLGGMLESLDQLFLGGGDSSFWNQLSEQILQFGDLSVFESSP